jgi:hypothetical protein
MSPGLKNAAVDPFGIVDGRDAFEASAVKANKYLPDGLREAVTEYSIAQTAKLKRARNVVAKGHDRIAELVKETALPPPDQSEAASRLRDRIWRQIENIPQGPERERTLIRLAERNPVVAEALREMPRELSGVAASTYDEIVGRLKEATHGPKIAELNMLREQVAVAQTNLDACEEELAHGAGVFSPADWAALTAHIHGSVPWLRKDGDRVIVVDMDKRVTRPASPQDIDEGRFFASFDEFKAANTA